MGAKHSKRGSYDFTKNRKKRSKLENRSISLINLTQEQIYEDIKISSPKLYNAVPNGRIPKTAKENKEIDPNNVSQERYEEDISEVDNSKTKNTRTTVSDRRHSTKSADCIHDEADKWNIFLNSSFWTEPIENSVQRYNEITESSTIPESESVYYIENVMESKDETQKLQDTTLVNKNTIINKRDVINDSDDEDEELFYDALEFEDETPVINSSNYNNAHIITEGINAKRFEKDEKVLIDATISKSEVRDHNDSASSLVHPLSSDTLFQEVTSGNPTHASVSLKSTEKQVSESNTEDLVLFEIDMLESYVHPIEIHDEGFQSQKEDTSTFIALPKSNRKFKHVSFQDEQIEDHKRFDDIAQNQTVLKRDVQTPSVFKPKLDALEMGGNELNLINEKVPTNRTTQVNFNCKTENIDVASEIVVLESSMIPLTSDCESEVMKETETSLTNLVTLKDTPGDTKVADHFQSKLEEISLDSKEERGSNVLELKVLDTPLLPFGNELKPEAAVGKNGLFVAVPEMSSDIEFSCKNLVNDQNTQRKSDREEHINAKPKIGTNDAFKLDIDDSSIPSAYTETKSEANKEKDNHQNFSENFVKLETRKTEENHIYDTECDRSSVITDKETVVEKTKRKDVLELKIEDSFVPTFNNDAKSELTQEENKLHEVFVLMPEGSAKLETKKSEEKHIYTKTKETDLHNKIETKDDVLELKIEDSSGSTSKNDAKSELVLEKNKFHEVLVLMSEGCSKSETKEIEANSTCSVALKHEDIEFGSVNLMTDQCSHLENVEEKQHYTKSKETDIHNKIKMEDDVLELKFEDSSGLTSKNDAKSELALEKEKFHEVLVLMPEGSSKSETKEIEANSTCLVASKHDPELGSVKLMTGQCLQWENNKEKHIYAKSKETDLHNKIEMNDDVLDLKILDSSGSTFNNDVESELALEKKKLHEILVLVPEGSSKSETKEIEANSTSSVALKHDDPKLSSVKLMAGQCSQRENDEKKHVNAKSEETDLDNNIGVTCDVLELKTQDSSSLAFNENVKTEVHDLDKVLIFENSTKLETNDSYSNTLKRDIEFDSINLMTDQNCQWRNVLPFSEGAKSKISVQEDKFHKASIEGPGSCAKLESKQSGADNNCAVMLKQNDPSQEEVDLDNKTKTLDSSVLCLDEDTFLSKSSTQTVDIETKPLSLDPLQKYRNDELENSTLKAKDCKMPELPSRIHLKSESSVESNEDKSYLRMDQVRENNRSYQTDKRVIEHKILESTPMPLVQQSDCFGESFETSQEEMNQIVTDLPKESVPVFTDKSQSLSKILCSPNSSLETSSLNTATEDVAEGQIKFWEDQEDLKVEAVLCAIDAIIESINVLNYQIEDLNASDEDTKASLYLELIKIMREVNSVNNYNFDPKILERQSSALNYVHACLKKLQSKS